MNKMTLLDKLTAHEKLDVIDGEDEIDYKIEEAQELVTEAYSKL